MLSHAHHSEKDCIQPFTQVSNPESASSMPFYSCKQSLIRKHLQDLGWDMTACEHTIHRSPSSLLSATSLSREEGMSEPLQPLFDWMYFSRALQHLSDASTSGLPMMTSCTCDKRVATQCAVLAHCNLEISAFELSMLPHW